MQLYSFKARWYLKKLFPDYLWKKSPSNRKTIYLTFDDGPTPVVTEEVLKILSDFNAKATFFLIGKNAVAHRDLVDKILNENHAIGNHTHNHLKGWETTTEAYIKNMVQAENILPQTNLFRPPYGKITKKQAQEILKNGYQIVMWDVLSGDFDLDLDVKTSFEKVLKYTSDGSIVVFHDSLKAKEKVLKILPQLLSHWQKEGYNFGGLN